MSTLKRKMFTSSKSSFMEFWRKTFIIVLITAVLLLFASFCITKVTYADDFKPGISFHITEKPLENPAAIRWVMDKYSHNSYAVDQRIFNAVSMQEKKLGLSGVLIAAVIAAESEFNPYAVSWANCRGLMQLSADKLADYTNIEKNVAIGSKYLFDRIKQFKSWKLGLAGYNAGPGAVIKYGYEIPPYSETQAYVVKVLKIYHKAITATTSNENKSLSNQGLNINSKNHREGFNNGEKVNGLFERRQKLQEYQGKQQPRHGSSSSSSPIKNWFRDFTGIGSYEQKNC